MQINLLDLVPQSAFDDAAKAIKKQENDKADGKLKRAMAAMAGTKLGAAMAEKFREIDLILLFAKGWAESFELQKAADTDGKSSAKVKFVRLGKFEQVMDLYPLLTVSALGFTSQPMKMTLTLQAEFEAVEVGLRKGYIIEIGGGLCTLSALLKWGGFSFPAGIAPIEVKMADTRKFDDPGLIIGAKKGK